MMEAPAALPADRAGKKFPPDRKRFQDPLLRHVPVLVLSSSGDIEYLTPAARRLLEYEQGSDPDPCFFSHVHARNQYQVMRDVADMVCYGKEQATWLLRLRSGRHRWRWYRAVAKNRLRATETAIHVTLRDLHDW